MNHLTGVFAHSQDEIKILGAVIDGIETAVSVRQCFSDREQMADIILASEHIDVEIGLEVRFVYILSGLVDFILIGIHTIAFRMIHDRLRHFVKRVTCQQVIMIA